MRRVAEIAAFLGLSAAVHAGVVAGFGDAMGGAQGQGAGGASRVTLQAAPESLSALADRWTTPPDPVAAPAPLAPPEIAVDIPEIRPETAVSSLFQPSAPVAPTAEAAVSRPEPPPAFPRPTLAPVPEAPALPELSAPQPQTARADSAPARPAAPRLAAPAPPEAPAADTAPPPPVRTALATDRSPRPPQRPVAAEPPAPASAPQPARVAAGTGTGATQGSAAPAAAPALSAGQQQSLMSQWGGQIMARIERARPRVRGEGQVLLALRVARDGQLAALSVSRSSGDPALDAAALDAVRRAGRFPAAPAGLTEASYGFSLPIRFR
ncbi:energy transducer TonB family protein [Roseicyclus persicicus]|uniref:Energy transducer TonB n=1 Tax=Roseicyclus persicicus TaxID=2650661 RepID=A0A7X6H0J8_9RHOB|nr:energy transducer TonB [Roseibacterium persicicum]NKX45139.1 energy transducer TonB [Roseibacterium persicicum]